MKRGQGALFLSILLIAVAIIIFSSLQFHWSKSIEKKSELEFKEDLYVTSNALKVAALYVRSSLDFSVYQAMYDTGKNGGWATKKNELNMNRDEVRNVLRKKIADNMQNYTNRNYVFLGKVIRFPALNESNIAVEELSNEYLNVSITTQDNIYFEEVKTTATEKKSVRLEISPNLNRIYDFKFFSLYEKSKKVFGEINDCRDEKRIDGNYEITINADKKIKPCTINVIITDTSREFPVFNGTGVSFEPISFEYLVKIT